MPFKKSEEVNFHKLSVWKGKEHWNILGSKYLGSSRFQCVLNEIGLGQKWELADGFNEKCAIHCHSFTWLLFDT